MSSRGWRLAVVAALAALAGAAVLPRLRTGALPRDMRLAELVQDLTVSLDGATIEASAPDAVHLGSIQTNPGFDGGFRRSIVGPPPAVVRFRVRVPEGGALDLATGVARQGRRNRSAAGVRFIVAVDGREVHERVVNPAAHRRDRRWFDERIDLARFAGAEVELALRTAVAGNGPVDGTPGWASVRLVRERAVARQPSGPAAPNVLVLLVDTLRADRLGCYGQRPSPSPTLDGLAETGVVFEQSVSQSSWTMPSVATLFTGLHPRSHGVVGGACLRGRDQRGPEDDEGACAYLADALPTLAERAQAAGVTTFGISANPLVSRATNFARGFETFVEFQPDTKWKQLAPAADVNRAFLEWVRPNRRHRFLAYLQYVDPHHPYTPPPPFAPPVPAGLRKAVANGHVDKLAHRINREGGPPLGAEEIAHLRALYDAEIRYWDSQLAGLLAALDDLGLRDSTVVVVTADHGEEFQDHGAMFHGTHLYDEQIRVPLVIAGPGIAPARVVAQAQGIDLFPTIAALLGATPPAGLPGSDLRAPAAPRPAFTETRHGFLTDGSDLELLAVRLGPWKLIHTPARGRFELYDLERDPGERDDRFGTAPEGEALARALADWQAMAPAPPAVAGAGDGRLHERLRALGYVQ